MDRGTNRAQWEGGGGRGCEGRGGVEGGGPCCATCLVRTSILLRSDSPPPSLGPLGSRVRGRPLVLRGVAANLACEAGAGAFERRAPEGHAGLIRSHRTSSISLPAAGPLLRPRAPNSDARAGSPRRELRSCRTADFYVSRGRCEGGRRAASTELRLAHRQAALYSLSLAALQYVQSNPPSRISPLLQNAKAKTDNRVEGAQTSTPYPQQTSASAVWVASSDS